MKFLHQRPLRENFAVLKFHAEIARFKKIDADIFPWQVHRKTLSSVFIAFFLHVVFKTLRSFITFHLNVDGLIHRWLDALLLHTTDLIRFELEASYDPRGRELRQFEYFPCYGERAKRMPQQSKRDLKGTGWLSRRTREVLISDSISFTHCVFAYRTSLQFVVAIPQTILFCASKTWIWAL